MLIIIDGRSIPADRIPGQNLEDILDDLQANHLPADRMIGDIILNGQSYSEDLPHAALEVDRSTLQSIEVITYGAEEMAAHLLRKSPVMLSAILQSIPPITEIFRIGDEAEANEHFLRFLESLHLLLNVCEQAQTTLNLNLADEYAEHGSFQNRLDSLAQILTQMLRVQEQSDWVYLADILEYELTPELEALHRLLPDLAPKGN